MPRTTVSQTTEATVRPVPRYGVFLGIGAVLGLIVAGILTMTGSFEPSKVVDVVYPAGQVFGFLLLWTVPIGIALGGLVALMLDRAARRHSRVVRVERERVTDSGADV